MRDGQVIEHWANRDDMGTALQLGWIPPSPVYLVRMARVSVGTGAQNPPSASLTRQSA